MKKYYILLAILGSIWGVIEVQFGTLLHATKLPFVGLTMMAIGVFFQTAARRVTGVRGSALLLGIVVSFVKMLFAGGIVIATVVAILIQSLLLEIIYAKRAPSKWRMATAAGVAVSYSLFHPFLSLPIFMGLTVVDAYHRTVSAGEIIFGGIIQGGVVILIALVVLHFGVGFVTGLVSFNTITRMKAVFLTPGGTDGELE